MVRNITSGFCSCSTFAATLTVCLSVAQQVWVLSKANIVRQLLQFLKFPAHREQLQLAEAQERARHSTQYGPWLAEHHIRCELSANVLRNILRNTLCCLLRGCVRGGVSTSSVCMGGSRRVGVAGGGVPGPRNRLSSAYYLFRAQQQPQN